MPTATRTSLAGLVCLCITAPAAATLYTVGSSADCSHSQLSAALAAAAADSSTGPHEIRLAVSELVADNLALANPVRDIEITGGYQSCSHGHALGTSSTVLQVNVANARVLQLHNDIENARRNVTLRRVVMRGGNLATAEGGGLLVSGALTAVLAYRTVVENNSASNGGGVHLTSTGTLLAQFAQLSMSHGSIVRNNRADTMLAQGYGGGIHCLRGCAVHPWHGEITGNFARRAGGGVALRNASSTMLVDPSPELDQYVLIADNSAGFPGAADNSVGGGIFVNEGTVSMHIWGPDSSTDFSVRLIGNVADLGGAIGALGPTSMPYRTVALNGALVVDNSARLRGGALYSRNGLVWYIDHDRVGDCPLAPGVRKPCSYFAGNASTNVITSAGGGVGYFANDVGSIPGITNITRTLFEDNADRHGLSAVIEAVHGQHLNIRRSVFVGNLAGAASGDRALFGGTDTRIDFLYNTVLDNAVGGLFYMHGGELRPLGSILWAPGRDLVYAYNDAQVLIPAVTPCLVTHTTTGLPTRPYWLAEPALDARFAPRGGSPALDHCANTGDVVNDLYGRSQLKDIPPVPDRFGYTDLGAVEQPDILMYNGFGNRPGN